jgi:UDP-N-acetylmuramoylalanine--D-glutamate ligase
MGIELTHPNDLRGRRVLLLGLGVHQGGVGVARFLVEHQAEVRVTDMQSREVLAGALAALEGLPIAYTLGRHAVEDFSWAEIVIRNPGVPRESPWLEVARESGAQIEMEMTLFFRFCRAPIIGVTGTKGKTTTTAILESILRQRWPAVIMAGNMGRTALGQIGNVRESEPVLLEISSFHLEALDEQRLSPHIGVLTNISADHLDRYVSLDAYAAVKAAIARHQSPNDWIIYSRDDERLTALLRDAPGRHSTFGVARVDDDHSLWVEDGRFRGRWDGEIADFGPIGDFPIPGEHNRLNALAAAAAGLAAGLSPDEITAGIGTSAPVANRLENIATIDGVDYINDTTATTPAATVAALQAFGDRRIIAIAGGSEKRVPLQPLADALAERAEHVVLLDGGATPAIRELLKERGYESVEGPLASMEDAVLRARDAATTGSVVLLSPGCASFGMFRNEFHRGDAFRAAVRALAGEDDS